VGAHIKNATKKQEEALFSILSLQKTITKLTETKGTNVYTYGVYTRFLMHACGMLFSF